LVFTKNLINAKSPDSTFDSSFLSKIFDVFDIKQATSGEAITGKLIWHSEYDLPIDLKKDISKIFDKYFVD